jgi:hypothetical protein
VIYKLFCVSIRRCSLYIRVNSCILHLLQHFEHTSTHAAELIRMATLDYSSPRVFSEIVR